MALTVKQVVQHLRSGVLEVVDVPCPLVRAGHVLIQTRASLISAGTERSIVEFGKSSLLDKVRQNPERVRQVLERIKSDGLLPTLELVFAKLDEPMPMGYCNVGHVVEVGAGLEGFAPGQRVVSNGHHAEMVCRPVNLCVAVPDEVSDEAASFTVLSAIGLQGIRLVAPNLGERVAVFGLGLIGLVAVQMLVESGVAVLGIDVDAGRLALAREFGAETFDAASGADPVAAGMAFSAGRGVDAALITASAKNDSIVKQSARMCRKRGRIVLVGVVDLNLDRADFYEKEISFQVSCSYGPGRYDPEYEDRGRDYPFGLVRWTEKRNMEAILGLMAKGRLKLDPLVTARVPIDEAARAYDLIRTDRRQLGVLLTYPVEAAPLARVVEQPRAAVPRRAAGTARVGVIGAGPFAKQMLLPKLAKTPAARVGIASGNGLTAAHAARKFGFGFAASDYRRLLEDDAINAVFIATPHQLHARMVCEALQAGKHVFVEKPLAIRAEGLREVREAYAATPELQLLVGFNRRFSPHALTVARLLRGRSAPICLVMTVNAGFLPADSPYHDPAQGGGRMIGEGCHFIDLMRFLVGAPITAVQSAMLGEAPGVDVRDDKMTVTLLFADGSLGTLHYLANGHRGHPKERLEVYSQGRLLALDNFRRLRGHGFPGFRNQNLWRQDKGHAAEIARFVEAVARGGAPVMPPDEIWNVTEATFAAVAAARSGERIVLPLPSWAPAEPPLLTSQPLRQGATT